MPTVYALNIRWVKSKIDPQIIENVLNRAGDWFRFNSWAWLLASDYSPNDIINAVKSVLTPEDSVLMIKCDLSVCGGLAPPVTWDWVINTATQPPQMHWQLHWPVHLRPLGHLPVFPLEDDAQKSFEEEGH